MPNRIKDLLKEKGVTQQELADRMGITRISIVKTIAGNPSQETFERIADALGVPMWQLFASPEETISESDFMALVKSGDDYYHANSLQELEKIVDKIKK